MRTAHGCSSQTRSEKGPAAESISTGTREVSITFTLPTSPIDCLHHLYAAQTYLPSLPLAISPPDGEGWLDPSIFHVNAPLLSCFSDGHHPCAATASWLRTLPTGSTTQTGCSCWKECLRNCPYKESGHQDLLSRAPGPHGSSGAGEQMVKSAEGNLLIVIREEDSEDSLPTKTSRAVAEQHVGQRGLAQ